MNLYLQRVYVSTLVLLFFLFHGVMAQKNIVPSYVVTHNSDTIRGYINNKNWSINPSVIEFRSSMQEGFQHFVPSQIKSFFVAPNEHYESHIVSIDKSPVELSKMVPASSSLTVVDTVFLTVCVKGAVSLYYFKDNERKTHFYIGKQASLEELILKMSVKEYDGKKVLWEDKQYKRQLASLLADCPTLSKRIKNLAYHRKPLQDLLIDYNQCMGASSTLLITSQEKSKLSIGFLAGGSLTSLDFKGNDKLDIVNAAFNKAPSYVVGINFDIALARNLRQWSIYNELQWKTYQTKSFYHKVESQWRYHDSNIAFDMGYITMINMIRYHFPFKKIRPFVNVGISNGLAVKMENSKVTETYYHELYQKESGKALEEYRKHEQGLVGGLGAEWQRLSGELRYELSNGMSAYTNLASSRRAVTILFTFRFK